MTRISSSSTSRPSDKAVSGDGKQSSFLFSFSIWNTMMGVSLLSMPWGLYQAGFAFGLFILLLMCLLCLYTSYLVVKSPESLEKSDAVDVEFAKICQIYFGKPGAITALVFSIMILVGAILAYWVLMSNFIYFSGKLLYEIVHPLNTTETDEEGKCSIHCRINNTFGSHTSVFSDSPLIFGLSFNDIWQLRLTVPIYLAILVFPLLNFKSPTFFTKFNILGTISVIYLLIFNGSRLIECGVNLNFSDLTSPNYVHNFSWNFPALTGMLTMSYFLHNAIITMLRNQRNPENNVRDLSIGYGLVAFSYTFVAFSFYAAFPLPRTCIGDNLLNNFHANNPMSAVARVLIFFQLLTILPLIMYFIRSQISCALFGTPWPGRVRVLILNSTIVCAGVLTAIFFPNIGSIIRYFGALSGLMYAYALPCMVDMRIAHRAGKLTPVKIIICVTIMVFGAANLVAQFFIK
uniref:Aa_trans domain-containing protein n=1 Tax=Haemonchus contortus TaxID=6289 RepID=A0A7I4YDI7_HAECO